MLRVVLVLSVLAAGCSGGSAASSGHRPTPPSPTASPSPRPAVSGDVDGDGRDDAVTVTPTTVSVALSGGGTVSAPLGPVDLPQPVLSGLHDVDGDHRAEVFVQTAEAPSAVFVQLYRYDGKALTRVRSGTAPLLLGIGGTITHGEGFSCPGGGVLVVRQAETLNGTGYTLRTRTYSLDGASATLRHETTVTAPSLEDPRVGAAFQVDCGSVGDGGS